MKILITGVYGIVGSYLCNELKKNHEIVGSGRRKEYNGCGKYYSCDITDKEQLKKVIKENKDLCKVLFCNQRDSSILNRILNIADQIDVMKLFNNHNLINKNIANYYMRYSVGGCISIIETWLENDLPESPEELVQIINGINQMNS